MDKEKFEKDMAVFSFRQIQDFITFSKSLRSHEYTVSDVEVYIETKRSEMESDAGPMRGMTIKCPECDAPMVLLPVNDKPSTRTGDDSQSVLMCHNKQCMYTEYSTKSVGEIIKELKISKS